MSMDSFCYSGGPNEIWSYGEEAYEILKKYVDIRESLRPYIYQNLKKASEDGTPIMRPLFYDYPDEANYEIFDQYMFGPDLLVKPITDAGITQTDVYLPAGHRWTEAATVTSYDGGQTVAAKATLEIIPVFVRDDCAYDIYE